MQREHLWAKLTFWTITRTKLHLGTESRSNQRDIFSLQLYDMICKLCYLILLTISLSYIVLIWVWYYRYTITWLSEWLSVRNNVVHWSPAVRTECCSSRAEVDANVRGPVRKEGSERCSWHWWSANWQGIMAQQVQQTVHNWLRPTSNTL